ncbi:TPA: DUF357 domain-containing protein [Candidatus Micrarchaeota archaeon]|nr:DUF357 domain-containing protein [Candidatus Micrarchaeota archaeon]
MALMDERERAHKDIEKLKEILVEFQKLGFAEKHGAVYEWAENYYKDAKHYFEKTDYFTAFGAANYAYGIIDGLLIAEGKK